MGKGVYMLCRVTKVEPDNHGVVMTVVIKCRPKISRDRSLPYVPKDLAWKTVSVQRVILLHGPE